MPCKLPTRPRLPWRPYHHHHHHFPILSTTYSRRPQLPPPWPHLITLHNHHQQSRPLSLLSIPTPLLPPLVFTGLLITLWTYKCLMMILFQNKIIYMPGMPPFSRSEKVSDYEKGCKPVVWTEHAIKSGDGTKLKVLEGRIPRSNESDDGTNDVKSQRHVVVLYFQGNASSLPPRLPYLSNILKLLHRYQPPTTSETQYTLLALSYRGFWTSKGRPSQHGIELDAQAALRWISSQPQYSSTPNTQVIIWGQSIGAGVATTALATWLERERECNSEVVNELPVAGLLLETPFTSLRAMLISLYPQKFLPYRYLGPFLTSTWDSVDALGRVSKKLAEKDRAMEGDTGSKGYRLKILFLEAENDELVPKEDATTLYTLCAKSKCLNVEHKVISGALHTDVMMKSEGRREIVRFLRSFEGKK